MMNGLGGIGGGGGIGEYGGGAQAVGSYPPGSGSGGGLDSHAPVYAPPNAGGDHNAFRSLGNGMGGFGNQGGGASIYGGGGMMQQQHQHHQPSQQNTNSGVTNHLGGGGGFLGAGSMGSFNNANTNQTHQQQHQQHQGSLSLTGTPPLNGMRSSSMATGMQQQQQQQQQPQPTQQLQQQQQQQMNFQTSPQLPQNPLPGGKPVNETKMPTELPTKLANRGHVYEYKGKKLEIRDVWCDNLEEEMKVIRKVITKYNYVAMDTEFPGVVARPIGTFSNSVEFAYQSLRCNVDLLKLIQLGIALCDKDGNFAEGCPCWQFHFKFSLTDDMYAQDSIDLLVRSGIDFELHEKYGIDVLDFGETLMSSGLVLVDDVRWITFHGSYDMGYLLKLLTCKPLPAEEAEFFKVLHMYFPKIFDVKHIMCKLENGTFKAGLSKLAEDLGVERIGPMHQAGSDSLLTASVFFALRKRYFNNQAIQGAGHVGVLHGLGEGDPSRF